MLNDFRGFRAVSVVAALGLFALSSSAANAAVVISNLSTPSEGVAGTDFRFGQPVVAGSTVAVNSITVPLVNGDLSSATARLLIRDAANGTSNVLYTLDSQTLPAGSPLTSVTFSAPPNTVLQSGTTYYVALSDGTGNAFSFAQWAYNSSAGTGAAGWTIPASLNNPSTGRRMLSIDATVVPEPTTLACLGLGGALLGRRRSR